VDDYVVPTSLNKGRGNVVPVVIVMLSVVAVVMRYDFWLKYVATQMRKGGNVWHLGKGAQNRISHAV